MPELRRRCSYSHRLRTDMVLLIAQANPKNTAVGWSQTCGYWRNISTCPARMMVYGDYNSSSGSCFNFSRCTQLNVSGGWWSGSIGRNCAGSDPYVSESGRDVFIDVWKALADGVWSSSVVISIYADMVNNPTSLTDVIHAGPSTGSSPASASISGYVPPGIGVTCSTTLRATLTVYDDGTFTLA